MLEDRKRIAELLGRVEATLMSASLIVQHDAPASESRTFVLASIEARLAEIEAEFASRKRGPR
jgi:hypothetical protein